MTPRPNTLIVRALKDLIADERGATALTFTALTGAGTCLYLTAAGSLVCACTKPTSIAWTAFDIVERLTLPFFALI